MAELGPLCAGIDPHPGLLAHWGLEQTVQGLETFARTCVEAFAGTVAVVKPQSAFFERFGSAGVAVTVSPYLGFASLRPALELAHENGRGVFVLALTSNPEGAQVQQAIREGCTVAGSIVDGVTEQNALRQGPGRAGELGSVGLVIGATVGDAVRRLGLDLVRANAPLLAPGVGAQGATAEDLPAVFGAALGNVLASSSRGILEAGPGRAALKAAARHTAEQLEAVLRP